MTFWQLTIDANDPARLARFWGRALGYAPTPPVSPDTTWWAHYRTRLGDEESFEDRLFDPTGQGPAIWFQGVPETKAGKNRLHLDLYPTGRDDSLSLAERIEIVDTKVTELVSLGATIDHPTKIDEPGFQLYFVVMHDPEGNEFCIS